MPGTQVRFFMIPGIFEDTCRFLSIRFKIAECRPMICQKLPENVRVSPVSGLPESKRYSYDISFSFPSPRIRLFRKPKAAA